MKTGDISHGRDHHERLNIRFGKIEAYAKRRLRVAPLLSTSISLSVQETSDLRSPSSPLLSLSHGETLSIALLDELLPSLHSVVWTFSENDEKTGNLTTISDNVQVTLSMPADSKAAAPLEAILRGAAARLVVAIGDLSLPSQKP
ncbi:hypothetical protein BN2475_10003 [Paraburkholderia ribeironis]|uniref:Uncharacterized protein n=1 Tax=Paraburkholderia ribeironis TaxID=1247936 RepID=A0A1N7RJH8_9BURK|nr:hypothetical protein [Paraburkholderia ribeironis]SIT34847.1 hypothetical protein BN2475_10003 [Paraburkholderia ribeironis]